MFQSLIVLRNDTATNARRSREYVDQLETHFSLSAQSVDISGCTAEKIHDVVAKTLDALDSLPAVMAIVGGDGTVSSVVHGVVMSPHAQALGDQLALFPLWGGNANDIATMLNGVAKNVTMSQVCERATVQPIYPLMVSVDSPGGSFERIATAYASFGATAEASSLMESSAHARSGTKRRPFIIRVGREILDFWRAIIRMDGFGMSSPGEESVHAYERLFINGPRIARIRHGMVQLGQRAYLEAMATKKNAHMLLYAYRLFVKKSYGTVTDQPTTFHIRDATMAQIDGEVIGIEPHTIVRVAIHETPFYAVAQSRQID